MTSNEDDERPHLNDETMVVAVEVVAIVNVKITQTQWNDTILYQWNVCVDGGAGTGLGLGGW